MGGDNALHWQGKGGGHIVTERGNPQRGLEPVGGGAKHLRAAG